MDTFRAFISESYDQNLTYLIQYLRDEPLPIINYREDFAEWVTENADDEDDDRVPALAAAMGISPDVIRDDTEGDWIDDLDWEHIDKMPPAMIREFTTWWKDEKIPYHMQHNPAEVPTWAHLSLEKKTVLPRTTWLVHLTDDPDGVASKGFNVGCDDVETLGLTTYLHQSRKKHGGYNFAFEADFRDVIHASNEKKYGEHAVMFQSSGVEVYHGADEEHQIIFWGPAVKPRDIVIIRRLDDGSDQWVVDARGALSRDSWGQKRSGRDSQGGGIFKGKSLKDCILWVEKNFTQYRRVLTGS